MGAGRIYQDVLYFLKTINFSVNVQDDQKQRYQWQTIRLYHFYAGIYSQIEYFSDADF